MTDKTFSALPAQSGPLPGGALLPYEYLGTTFQTTAADIAALAAGSGTVTNIAASGGVQTASGSAITTTGTIRGANIINAQTGTTYALVAADRGKHVTLSNAAAIAVSIAQAGTTGFEDGYYAFIENIGVGAVTITPTTSTINGASTLVLNQGMTAILFSDGTNYRAFVFNAAGIPVNAQTGTSYTYLNGDRGKLVTHTNAAAIAGTLPQATGAFGAGWFMWVQNRGAGTLTITPSTSTIDGASTLALTTGQGVLIASDGANYFTMRGMAAGGGGGLTNFTDSVNTATPNATIPVVALTASNAATDVDVAIQPKGAGALSRRSADNTSTGGNKRGARSVDWQFTNSAAAVASGADSVIAGGNGNTASGANSVVGGGTNNTAGVANGAVLSGNSNSVLGGTHGVVCGGNGNSANGTKAACLGGDSCTTGGTTALSGGSGAVSSGTASVAFGDTVTASAAAAVAMGLRCTADAAQSFVTGHWAWAKGVIGARVHQSNIDLGSNLGGRQQMVLTLQCNTPTNSAVRMTTNGGAAAANNQFFVTSNTTRRIKGQVVVRNTANGDCGGFDVTWQVKDVGGTTSAVGTPTISAYNGDASLNTVTVACSFDNTNKAASIECTGLAGTALKWAFEGSSIECGS